MSSQSAPGRVGETYLASQSPLFRIGPATMAERLGEPSFRDLDELANKLPAENYAFFELDGRDIERPNPRLDLIQKRIAKFLSKITPPDYLQSGVKGRSYRTNAERHLCNRNSRVFTMDIRRFFQSTSSVQVWNCFTKQFQCKPDIASVLTKLCTVNGHIPTGSSVSTILSFFAYRPMFDLLNHAAITHGATFSCYVDDLTFSGDRATKKLASTAKRIIRKFELTPHPSKTRHYSPADPKLVTGVIICSKGLRLPNVRRRNIHDDFQRISDHTTEIEREAAMKRLIGRLSEAATLEERFAGMQSRLKRRM